MVKPFGLETGQVWQALPEGGGANRRGLTREAVIAAVERAGPTRPAIEP